MQRRFRRTCPLCGRPDLKNISTHLLQVHGLSSKERKPYLKQARVSSWHPYADLSRGEKPSQGEQEVKKIKMAATTLSAEKKRQEKMANAPLRTAASEPGDTSQHTTETKKVELNKLYSNTPVHMKIMQTKDALIEIDDFDPEEALEAAVDKRTFLIRILVKN